MNVVLSILRILGVLSAVLIVLFSVVVNIPFSAVLRFLNIILSVLTCNFSVLNIVLNVISV